MKVVFNILILLVVAAVIWTALPKEHEVNNIQALQAMARQDFDGARSMKTCKNITKGPSAIAIDKDNDMLYIMSTGPDPEAPAAYINKASMEGEILDTINIQPLDNPGGITICNGNIYIINGKQVIQYSIAGDSVEAVTDIPQAGTLCDIEHDKRNRIYVSDSKKGCIYRLADKGASIFASDTLLYGISGMCLHSTTIMACAGNRIIALDGEGHVSTYARMDFQTEYLRSDGDSTLILNDNAGNIYAANNKQKQLIMKRQPTCPPAMFDYMPNQRRLFVPYPAANSIEVLELGRYLEQ